MLFRSLGKVKWTGKESKYDIGTVVDASGKRLEAKKEMCIRDRSAVTASSAYAGVQTVHIIIIHKSELTNFLLINKPLS